MDKHSIDKFAEVKIPETLSENVAAIRHTPTALYNGMVSPYKNFKIKGVLWYQGESDLSTDNYESLFTEFISNWRRQWQMEELPVYFVQIAPYEYGSNSPNAADTREAQLNTFLNVPNTGMVVTTDVGDCKDIHPSQKEIIGKRLAYWALADSYHIDIPHQSPVFNNVKPGEEPGEVILSFDHAELGFSKQNDISGFLVAGRDSVFLPAKVKINNDNTVRVWNETIKRPQYLKYGYENCPEANLVNTFGFPTAPFRTEVKY